jgi:uncharacterized membrane protein YphA (DoxX/SURF4 family)
MKYLDWLVRIVAAVILLQTLYFKFLGAEESVYIFSELGVEPWGRYASGMTELAAAILILIPRTAWLGCLVGLGVMAGALLSHLFVLGIEVQGDGGLLFTLALVVTVCCLTGLLIHRKNIPLPANRTGTSS